MATFTTFSNILPDPANPITDAGDASPTGTPGPGFSALSFQSITDTQVSRTVSGRGVQRDGGSQHWEFTISYNPMFRYQFDPIDTFLLARNPRRDPFYVILPQYSKPKDPTFAVYLNTHTLSVQDTPVAGSTNMLINHDGGAVGLPKPGDMFNIVDPGDFNHQKIYKITRVETPSYYQAATTAPTANQFRIHFSPPLQRSIQTPFAPLRFLNPLFRVIAKGDVQEHSLNTDNLYSFSLAVEEIQP